ncbi:MAG TPA: hypothetical protein VJ837_06570 [Candidatus Paceibacterota bacterium]|nr:hypothetical protein [Candidatus Paceibacterota bacterium]
MQKAFFTTVILIVLLLLAGFLAQVRQERQTPARVPISGGAVSIEGTYICLPHRDTDGPQTLECALGLAGEDGNNYSLDLNEVGFEALGDIGTGERVRVEGVATPVEALRTDMWWKYDMVGIITVESIIRI